MQNSELWSRRSAIATVSVGVITCVITLGLYFMGTPESKFDSETPVNVTVPSRPISPPIIARFFGSELYVAANQRTTLSWEARNAERCSIDKNIGMVPLKGSVLVRPSTSTRYTISCSVGETQTDASVVIEVVEALNRCAGHSAWDDSTCGDNERSMNSGTTVAGKAYRGEDGIHCREYDTTYNIGGSINTETGIACRQPDGSWKIILKEPLAK